MRRFLTRRHLALSGMELGYFLQEGDTAHTLSFVFFKDEAAMLEHNDGGLAEELRRASRFIL